MAYEELFADLLKAEREEDVTAALKISGLEKFSDSNWLPYGGIENNYGIIGAQQADARCPISRVLREKACPERGRRVGLLADNSQ